MAAAAATIKMMTTDMGHEALRTAARKTIEDDRKLQAPIWPNIMQLESENVYMFEYTEDGGFGDIPLRDEGDYINFATPDTGELLSVQPEVRQLAFAVTKEDRKYNKTGKVARASRMLARAAKRTYERIAAYPFNVATSTVRRTIDGLALLNHSHTLIDGTLVSNIIGLAAGGAGSQSDLTIAALESALVAFSLLRDNDGSYIDVTPKILMVHPAEAPNARRVLRSTSWWAATGTTDTTPTAVADRGIPNATVQDANLTLVVNPYLTDTDGWWLLTDKANHHMRMYQNEAMNDRSFVDPYNEDYIYSIEFAAIAAAASWKGIMGTVGG